MQVWAVTFDHTAVGKLDDVYNRAFGLLDPESQERLSRFYHKEDSFRGLVGRLLPRVLLKQKRNVALRDMKFSRTSTGKPYVDIPGLDPRIGYNITHDNGVIAMAFANATDLAAVSDNSEPAYTIGVDVMKLQLPRRHTLSGFVDIVSDQLTPLEHSILLPPPSSPIPQSEALRRFYLIWTLKESYTKALGLGLGFDFSRIEYDVPNDAVRIDGVPPRGWEFVRFELCNRIETEEEIYVGVATRLVGEGSAGGCEGKVETREAGEWLKVIDARAFIEKALCDLEETLSSR